MKGNKLYIYRRSAYYSKGVDVIIAKDDIEAVELLMEYHKRMPKGQWVVKAANVRGHIHSEDWL